MVTRPTTAAGTQRPHQRGVHSLVRVPCTILLLRPRYGRAIWLCEILRRGLARGARTRRGVHAIPKHPWRQGCQTYARARARALSLSLTHKTRRHMCLCAHTQTRTVRNQKQGHTQQQFVHTQPCSRLHTRTRADRHCVISQVVLKPLAVPDMQFSRIDGTSVLCFRPVSFIFQTLSLPTCSWANVWHGSLEGCEDTCIP